MMVGSVPSRVTVVHSTPDERSEQTLTAVAETLVALGAELRHLTVPASGYPAVMTAEERHTASAFTHTPEALIAGWRAARHITALTRPGETVLVSEAAGAGGGMFALEQAMIPPDTGRIVIVAAGDGEVLRHLAIAGTIEGVGPVESSIDWELAAYRFGSAVLATSALAVHHLASLGVEAHLAALAVPPPQPLPARGGVIFLVDPAGRLARTAEILRGIAEANLVGAEVVVSPGDQPDRIFTGTAWDTLAGVRQLLGGRVTQGVVDHPSVAVVGDPYRLPDAGLERLRATSRMIVPAASALAARWPEAETWREAADLAVALRGGGPKGSGTPPAPAQIRLRPRRWAADRARRVSVAVPVFRDTRFLAECIGSIAAQTQAPEEIIIIDDGSRSAETTAALEAVASEHRGLVRVVAQENRGVCVARNKAWEAMAGDAHLFVDSDDVLAPDFIAATADALRANPDLWAVATWTDFFGTYEGVEAKPPFDRRVGLRENPIISTSVLLGEQVRRTGIRFAPDLAFLYCEDWEVWSKIVAAGGALGLVPRPLAAHRVHGASGGFLRTDLAYSLGKARATIPLGECR